MPNYPATSPVLDSVLGDTDLMLAPRRLRRSKGAHTFSTREVRWYDMPSLAVGYAYPTHRRGLHAADYNPVIDASMAMLDSLYALGNDPAVDVWQAAIQWHADEARAAAERATWVDGNPCEWPDSDETAGPYDNCDLHPGCADDCQPDASDESAEVWQAEQSMLNRLGVI